MLTDQLKTQLESQGIAVCQWRSAMDSDARIEKIKTDDGLFWLKKAAPARGVFRYHALNLFSWVLRLPLLKAVPQPGGNEAISIEVNRIKTLAKAGVLVPELVVYDNSWLLIKDVGQSIVKSMKNPQTSQNRRQQLLKACLNAIKELHQQDLYLSQGFIRNMLLANEQNMQVAFIDFEDDPLSVMSLAEAQARDVLLLVNSTARFFVADRAFFTDSIQ
ncbi:MAG: lipopolysaccharide kinase InaA family protein, partial [Marinicella sp.]